MPPADGEYISLRSKNIHYVEQSGRGTPVLLLHGLPGTHKDFDPLMPHLGGLHVAAIDRPGFGWSTGGVVPFQEQIDVVHDFLTQRKLAPAVVVGHSFGGTLALGLARRYPQDVAKMILIAPGAGGMRANTSDTMLARYIRFSQLPVIKSVVNRTYGNIANRLSAHFGAQHAFAPGDIDPTYAARLVAVTLTPGNLEAFASEQLEFGDTMQWVDDNVPEIDVPSVQLAATEDELVPHEHAGRLAETSPNSELITVDGSHMIPYTHPDVVAQQIREAAD
ncbi:alpha/beta fold hydrolase [Mycobacterium hubeiense]|uniref:alpha/beta fold hydrolase n=1 Tax=Mycobacterium hubeiense TaxID=1867256 RepID=UPI003D67AD3D